jgi:general secretion pathway protein D
MHRHNHRLAAAIGLGILLAGGGAWAQFNNGDTLSSTPWASFKLNPKTRIKLDFKNANIDLVISFISKQSGVTILKDPSLTGPITVSSAQAVPLSEAFAILNDMVSMKGYSIVKKEQHLVISQNAKQNAGGGRGRFNTAGDTSGLTTDTTNPFSGFPGAGGQTPKVELRVYTIQYASSSAVAKVISDVFSQDENTTSPFGRMPFGGGRGRFGMQQTTTNSPFGNVRASSDDYSNSVIVNATAKDQEQVAAIIKQIDKQADTPMQSKVFKLKYAVASDMVTVVQTVLNQNAPKGKGGGTSTANQGPMPFFMRGNNSQNAGGTATADTRTNSLVVSATEDNVKIIDGVVKELDQKVELSTTTFVFPLANARADVVATLLTSAFGSLSGTNSTRTNTNSNITYPFNTTISPTTSSTSSTSTGSRSLTGDISGNEASNLDPNQLELALQNPNSQSGDLLTQVNAQGFGGFGGMFGGQTRSTSSSTTTQTGFNSQGQVVPVTTLAGQVTVIADPNTNSLIIVTLPQNADMIKEMLKQLDKIPQQVMIETIIVEATLDSTDQFGVEWKYVNNNVGSNTSTWKQTYGLQTGTTSPTGGIYTLSGGPLTAFLNAVQTDTKFTVLSTPRIFTANNSVAQINISQSLPYVLSTSTDTLGNTQYNYGFMNVGIVLTVLPRITSEGYVAMDIAQTANDFVAYTSFNAPIVNQREATTSVAVKDGETVILGGIIRNQVTATTNKIPLLGDIPLLGNLFKSVSHDKEKTELLIFLTPHVIRTMEEARKLSEDTKKEMSQETQKNVKSVVVPPPPIKSDGPNQ